MGFSGFGEQVVDFYEGLAADNSKVYWDGHKSVYAADVRAPMVALLEELESEFGKGAVFRPHRDVRFAKDKSPYKTHCGAVIEQGRGGGAYYVQVSAEGLTIGGGSYAMASDQLARYRTAVDGDTAGPALEKILETLSGQGWEILGDRLKTRPRGVDPGHPRLELLRHRSIYTMRSWDPDDVLHEPETLDRVRAGWRQLRGFNEWCADHIGVSDQGW
ncbi:MAG: DUF2461 domain-containing protein [Mycobacteriaceae bacterium]|nr:DUF2461 domain-containing protein [Mycobacteriaceae bacterium]